MKRTLSIFLALLLALTLTAPAALADVVWEPVSDSFYDSHRDDFSYFGRSLYLNGQDGVTVLYKSPDGDVIGSVPNGETVYAEHSWRDWYLIFDPTAEEYSMDTCYIRISDAVPVYDSAAFLAEYGESITTVGTPRYPTLPEDAGQKVCLYSYPGSGEVWTTMDPEGCPGCSLLFTDEDGLAWGFVNYWYGVRDVWMCLDDPCNDTLPYKGRDAAVLAQLIPAADPEKPSETNAEPEAQTEPAQEAVTQPEPAQQSAVSRGISPLLLVGIIVSAVVAVTAVILILSVKKRKIK